LDVLIVGATGVFGSRLARLAATEVGVRLTLAGRRRRPLEALAFELGGSGVRLVDRDSVGPAELAGFDLVVDCAGPFQGSRTQLIRACIEARVNYADLADGRKFVTSITRFDRAAKAAGTCILSGASSIPALSHAVLDELTRGWRRIDSITVGIFPGNRAPRGRSVVEAILSYVGKPVRVFRAGGWTVQPGWALHGRVDCGPVGRRWASVCDTPDQDLLVSRYRPADSAEFVAGLEMPVLHLGLWLLSWPVRWGWIESLRPAAGALLWIAQKVRRFGSDRGAMLVTATGEDLYGWPVRADWTLDATGNRGPYVPVLAAAALIARAAQGRLGESGARPCSGELDLAKFEPWFRYLGIKTSSDVRRVGEFMWPGEPNPLRVTG
jgi:hypothetical protein